MERKHNGGGSGLLAEPRSLQEAEALLKQLVQEFEPLPVPSAALPAPRGKRMSDRPAGSGSVATAFSPAAVDRLKQTEARYRTLVEQIPAITFMASLDGQFEENEIYVSPHIETMLGFTQAEWLGDPFLWYRQLHPDDRARWGLEFARTCSAGVNFRSEYRFISRDNREVWVHGEARVVRDDQGRPLFLQGIAYDITESKRAEQSLRRSAEDLERSVRERTIQLEEVSIRAESANRARASFLANMSHEIRTPLNGIIGFADLLRRGAASDEAERVEWLEIIRSSGEHLLALINDILDLSKIDAGKLSVETVDCSPGTIIEEVCLMLRSKADEKGLQLSAVFDGPLPQTIRSDPTRLRQVLVNLAGNAIKFTAKGQVQIAVRLDRPQGAEPQLVMRVIDTGIGIAPEKLESIFDPFTQADSSITRQFGGTGLGLAISRRLADALGGTVAVHSEVGRGTTFTFVIPVGQPEQTLRLETRDQRVVRSGLDVATGPLVLSHRVLVVDDGETNRKLIRVILEHLGATILQAENGQQAVDMVLAESFDLILMDMQMPVMDGYTAVQQIRARGLQVPIIALTANAMKGDEEKCRQAGCSGYVSKPITQKQLLAAVAEALGLAGKQPSGRPTPSLAAQSPATQTPAVQSPAPQSPAGTLRTAAAPVSQTGVLVSTLPADDADFREIVVEFVQRLGEKLVAMRAAWAAEDLPELVALAHWLKGAGGSAGFPALTQPAQQLEQFARQGRSYAIEASIVRLEQLARSIVTR
ncbi:MAG TPA: ATP-binding protein [Pirellulales bacterium]|jgi:PAS domain S-box-containing protein|nr:ATP-binding protein [Pirellulales bacterium]